MFCSLKQFRNETTKMPAFGNAHRYAVLAFCYEQNKTFVQFNKIVAAKEKFQIAGSYTMIRGRSTDLLNC